MNLTFNQETNYFSFFEITSNVQIFLKICYFSISIISIFGNCLIIYAVFNNKRMHNVTNYFITNLAIVDIAISIFSTPFQVKLATFIKQTLN